MQKKMICLALIVAMIAPAGHAHPQEAGLATFRETAQVIIDKSISGDITASITLQSTSTQEIKIPQGLEERIRQDGRINAVIVTNEDMCVLGVQDESCIMINVIPDPSNEGIIEIQDHARDVSQLYIDEINGALDTEAEFHSVFIHSNDRSNQALQTSGVVSGRGSISAVYTMPMEDTDSMYEKISAILIPREIRDGGGFYETARGMAAGEGAKVSFSILPQDPASLLQLKVSTTYPGAAEGIAEISPLEFLGAETITRSGYFASGFYPLNSLVQVAVLSPEPTSISDVGGDIVPTRVVGGDKVPTEVTRSGWIFDPEEGELIQGKFIFGQKASAGAGDLAFAIGGQKIAGGGQDDSVVIVGIIAVVAVAAALFYLRGYRGRSD